MSKIDDLKRQIAAKDRRIAELETKLAAFTAVGFTYPEEMVAAGRLGGGYWAADIDPIAPNDAVWLYRGPAVIPVKKYEPSTPDMKIKARADNTERFKACLVEYSLSGIAVDSFNAGAHLVVKTPGGSVYDFWPGTLRWRPRESRTTYLGIAGLVSCILREIMPK